MRQRNPYLPTRPVTLIYIRHASVLTLDESDNFYYPATVIIEDDVITDVYEEGRKHLIRDDDRERHVHARPLPRLGRSTDRHPRPAGP